jgi:hypothetical protein
MIQVVHPGSGSRIRILIFYPSRIQGSKSHWIPDLGKRHRIPDPQHWLIVCVREEEKEPTYLISMDMPWDSMVYLISAMMVRLAASIPRVQAT